jgi:hypothetical protein
MQMVSLASKNSGASLTSKWRLAGTQPPCITRGTCTDGPKRREVTVGLRKLNNEELHNLYSSPNIIGLIKSKGMRWAEHVDFMEAR